MKSGNISETCRHREIAPNLYCRRKDETQQVAKVPLRGEALSRRNLPPFYYSRIALLNDGPSLLYLLVSCLMLIG